MPHDGLRRIVGDGGWVDDPAALEPHLTEWRDTWRGRTPLMLQPATVDEVAAVVRHCAKHRIGLVPQGGNTGLCGGAIPDASNEQVLLSLRRLNRVRGIDPDNFSLTAEAGCVLADLQQAARDRDRLLALSLAAEGSCQIGGNLSTNAGGINVLRYGTARDQVLGLEVVLPDGEVLNGLRALRKDTAGYDLKQLFIGAEGTLGIITAATVRLFPDPGELQSAFLAVGSPQQAVRLLGMLRGALADGLQAFELLSARALRYALRHVPGLRAPLTAEQQWFVLFDTAGRADDVEAALAAALSSGLASDGVLAKNAGEREAFWRLRHSISAAQKPEGASLKHDVSVPVGAVGEFIEAAEAAVVRACPGVRPVVFGHVGDGNVHFNLTQPVGADRAEFLARRTELAGIVYDVTARFEGSFSAEHGVGVLKRDELARYRGGTELALMRRLKQALDPLNIMNPGKVL